MRRIKYVFSAFFVELNKQYKIEQELPHRFSNSLIKYEG